MHLSTLRRGPGPSAAEPAPTLKSIRAATIPVLGRITWSCPVKNHCLHLITFDSQQDKSEPLIYPPPPLMGEGCPAPPVETFVLTTTGHMRLQTMKMSVFMFLFPAITRATL